MKKLVIVLGIIIVVLLGVLLFYNPVHGPAIPAQNGPSSVQPAK
jgi:hypothetical protein